jgi:sodium/proline symporter
MNVYEKLSDPLALAVFAATLLLPVLVGFAALRRTRDQSDFFVGGRAMGRVVVALSAVSSGRSSWLILGVSGLAYTLGVAAVWAVVGYTTVELAQFLTIGPRLRRATERHGSITLLDYFESRFEDRRHLLRLVGAAAIACFTTAYVAAQLNAGAKTLESALGLPLGWCLAVSAAVIVVYMVLGGFVAVAYNDVVRAVIMLFGLVVLPAVVLANAGGMRAVTELLAALDPSLLDPRSLGFGAFLGLVGIGLGSPGQPHILVRYMSIDHPDRLRGAAVIGTLWNVVLGLGAVSIGVLGRAMTQPDALPDGDPELIYLVLSSQHFGPLLYGLLVGGVFAAILSTADSQLLVVASTIVRDLWEKTFARVEPADERAKLALSRVVVVLAGVAALLLAYFAQDLVFWLVLFAWGGLGAALGPALILALYWPRTTRNGAAAGMVVGTAVTIVWRLWLKEPTGIYELVPAFFSALAAVVLVSLAGSSPARLEGGGKG